MTSCYCGAEDAQFVTLPDASRHDLCEDCEMAWRTWWSIWAALAPNQANTARRRGLSKRVNGGGR